VKAAAYLRVSTDKQEDSPDVQRAIISAYCDREGHSLVAEYLDEAVSGGLPIADRPAAGRMLADAKAHKFEAIIVKQLDRLGRNAADTISFPDRAKKLGVKLLVVQETFADTPAGRIHYGVLALLAQYYREDIGQKIRDANLHKARVEGRWMGGQVPYGYVYLPETKRLQPDPARADDVRKLFETYVRLSGSREGTAKELNRLRIPGPAGTSWWGVRVKRIVSNPIYRGYHRYGGEHHKTANFEPAVPLRLAEEAWRLYQTTQARTGSANPEATPTYSGLLWCGFCGARLVSAQPGKERRGIARQYRCRMALRGGRAACDSSSIAETRLDCLLVPQLAKIVRTFRSEIRRQIQRGPSKQNRRNPRQALEDRRRRLVEVYVEGHLSRADFDRRCAAISEEILRADARPPDRPQFDPGLTEDLLGDLAAFWRDLDAAERRAVLSSLTSRITIWTGRPARAVIESPLVAKPLTAELAAYRCRL
jgi:site-specific DNA recombinase